jgi:hypothetical protein
MVKYATVGSKTLYQLHSILNLKKCSDLEQTFPEKPSNASSSSSSKRLQ